MTYNRITIFEVYLGYSLVFGGKKTIPVFQCMIYNTRYELSWDEMIWYG